MDFTIGGKNLGAWSSSNGKTENPNPGPKSTSWHLAHVIEIKQIPGKGKKFITVRTSDKYIKDSTGTLWECDLVIRSITDDAYQFYKSLCEEGGPFEVKCNHGTLNMYIVDVSIQHDENDKEKPLTEIATGEYLNVATWTIKLQEAHD